jgi:hypothetical protein
VGGKDRGRRVATLQLNYAYALMLSSHFQGFCRDLQTEAVEHIAANTADLWVRGLLREALTSNRTLDRGNPHAGNIGTDFKKLGFDIWPAVDSADGHAASRKRKLAKLNAWRNAVAHQDFRDISALRLNASRMNLQLADVKGWRQACDGLAVTMDEVVGVHVAALVGRKPW